MSILNSLYDKAREQTIERVLQDVCGFLETSEKPRTYDEYRQERGQYILHLWLNTWINIASSQTPVKNRKIYLTEKGYDVEELSRKQVNQLFRNEVRNYRIFDAVKWLDDKYMNNPEGWEKRYHEARQQYLIREEERKLQEARNNVKNAIRKFIDDLLEKQYLQLYIHVRYHVAGRLVTEIKQSGYVQSTTYITLQDLWDELAEQLSYSNKGQSRKFDWESFEDKYHSSIIEYLFDFGPKWMMDYLPAKLSDEYSRVFSVPLTISTLKGLVLEQLYDIGNEFLYSLKEEYAFDLVELTNVPFEPSIHMEIYQKNIDSHEQRRAEETAELERKQEERAKMMEDIFGREYSTNIGHSIKYVLHVGETNTGKTFHALNRMKDARSGLYLAPLRLLALEVFDKLNGEHVPCSLKTGEEEKVHPDAQHLSCTVEMFHEKDFYEVVVIDEAQMIADRDRGFSWYKAITKANANEVHIVGSYSMKSMILQLLGETNVEIHEYNRDIPLEVESREFSLKQARKGDALVCFSRNRVLETASILQGNGHKVSMIYGSMPPETRKMQMKMFINGETTVIVATDAIGMGLNLPIRRIVFLANEKFDGVRRRTLTSQEIKQIAGRAGRKGLYEVGKVAFTQDIKMMSRLLQQQDEPLHTFSIAPTSNVLDRYQRYSRSLGTFFELWEEFENPIGTKKASLTEVRELYESIRGTQVEARLSLRDLYGFLNLPFSSFEPELSKQWRANLLSIIEGDELPEPVIKNDGLEELELSYKSIGLHLLFLYRLDKRTETLYWERVREEISKKIHDILKTNIKVTTKKCRTCGENLPVGFKFSSCNHCYHSSSIRRKTYFHR
jgi:ATP-dependent RNA helicase SUPV3L1/SUV3